MIASGKLRRICKLINAARMADDRMHHAGGTHVSVYLSISSDRYWLYMEICAAYITLRHGNRLSLDAATGPQDGSAEAAGWPEPPPGTGARDDAGIGARSGGAAGRSRGSGQGWKTG